MNLEILTQLIVGYAQLSHELKKVGLLLPDMRPNKKELKIASSTDRDMVELLRPVSNLIYDSGANDKERMKASLQAKKAVEEVGAAADSNFANPTLFALEVLVIATDKIVGPSAMLVKNKALRLAQDVGKEVEKCENSDVRRRSFYLADSVCRHIEGRPIVSESVRKMMQQRLLNKLKNKEKK
jgi:predicted metal-dependent HD superfamily phosphohydrolase